MAVYAYRAMDLDSSTVAGTIVADTPRQARDVLRDRGLTVTEVRQAERQARARWFGGVGRRGQGEAVSFIRELATLLATGIPLLWSLQTLSRQHGGRFRAVIQHLADAVAAGTSLAEAMERQPAYFDAMCVNIVRVGERTGGLDAALNRLADFKEKARRLRSRVVTALIYPAVVCLIGLAVCAFLMTYVVPNLLTTLSQAGKDLPAVTQAVKAVSDFLVDWWWLLIACAAGAVLGVRAAVRTEAGRRGADRLKLRVPVIGELIRKEKL